MLCNACNEFSIICGQHLFLIGCWAIFVNEMTTELRLAGGYCELKQCWSKNPSTTLNADEAFRAAICSDCPWAIYLSIIRGKSDDNWIISPFWAKKLADGKVKSGNSASLSFSQVRPPGFGSRFSEVNPESIPPKIDPGPFVNPWGKQSLKDCEWMQIMRSKWTFNWNLFKQSTVFGPDNMKSADMNVQTGQLTRRFNGEIHVVNHNLFSNIRLPQNRNDLNSERTWYTYFSRGLLGVDWVRIRFKNYKAYKCFQFPFNYNFHIYKLYNIKAIKPVWKKSRIKNKRYACLIEPCAIFRKKFFGKESTTLKLLSKKKHCGRCLLETLKF